MSALEETLDKMRISGLSEALAVAEAVNDALGDFGEEENPDLDGVDAMMDAFIEWANEVKQATAKDRAAKTS